MYINRQAKMVFLAQPRTASRSVGAALKTRGFEAIGHHRFDESMDLEGFTVATAVRNPFDYLVSWYHHMQSIEKCLNMRFEINFINELWHDQGKWFEPNRMFRFTEFSDTVFRYEYLETALNTWLQLNGLHPVYLEVLGMSVRGPTRLYYDDETRALVEREYAQELSFYRYSYPSHKIVKTDGSAGKNHNQDDLHTFIIKRETH